MHTPKMTTKTKGVEYAPTRRFPAILGSGSKSTVSGTRLAGHGLTYRPASHMHHNIANLGTIPKISGREFPYRIKKVLGLPVPYPANV